MAIAGDCVVQFSVSIFNSFPPIHPLNPSLGLPPLEQRAKIICITACMYPPLSVRMEVLLTFAAVGAGEDGKRELVMLSWWIFAQPFRV